jgi:SAM-dependent methyltransferase
MTAAEPPISPTLQEAYYDDDVNYRVGSPHLTHWALYERLVGIIRDSIGDLSSAGLTLEVLEIGAGHGGFTEPVLAAGCQVTVVEASRPSLQTLERRYGHNPGFRAVFDPDGSLNGVSGTYSLILIVSVLHHIPDYVSFLDRVTRFLKPGGTLLTLQDPLWYSRLPRVTHTLNRGGYLLWRLGQGNAKQGLSTLSRRVRGVHDPTNPADMVEYHVVRAGVDEQAVTAAIGDRFDAVKLLPYWSNQLGPMQRVGDRLGLANTFGVLATSYRPAP